LKILLTKYLVGIQAITHNQLFIAAIIV